MSRQLTTTELFALGELFYKRDFDKALDIWNTPKKPKKEDTNALIQMAEIYEHEGMPSLASESFETASRLLKDGSLDQRLSYLKDSQINESMGIPSDLLRAIIPNSFRNTYLIGVKNLGVPLQLQLFSQKYVASVNSIILGFDGNTLRFVARNLSYKSQGNSNTITQGFFFRRNKPKGCSIGNHMVADKSWHKKNLPVIYGFQMTDAINAVVARLGRLGNTEAAENLESLVPYIVSDNPRKVRIAKPHEKNQDSEFVKAKQVHNKAKYNKCIEYAVEAILNGYKDKESAYALIGKAIMHSGRESIACRFLNRMLSTRKYKDSAKLHSLYGTSLQREGRNDEAIKYLNIALEKNPNNCWAKYSLAKAHSILGEQRKAVKNFKEILQIDAQFAYRKKIKEHLAKATR